MVKLVVFDAFVNMLDFAHLLILALLLDNVFFFTLFWYLAKRVFSSEDKDIVSKVYLDETFSCILLLLLEDIVSLLVCDRKLD